MYTKYCMPHFGDCGLYRANSGPQCKEFSKAISINAHWYLCISVVVEKLLKYRKKTGYCKDQAWMLYQKRIVALFHLREM